jgi:glycine oxidase
MTRAPDVAIIGGGIVGAATAYFLGEAGISTVVIERDAVGSHASGHAYGGLSAMAGPGVHGPTQELSRLSVRLYREMAATLPDETGVNMEYRNRPSMILCFTDEEAAAARDGLPVMQREAGYTVSWLEGDDLYAIEPRISPEVRGAVYIEGTSDLEPQRLTTALAKGAEIRGARFEPGEVTGVTRDGAKVTGVSLADRHIACDRVVIAMGPWSGAASGWLGFPIAVRPLKGQILRLRASGPPYRCSMGWAGNYAVTKPDGLVWAGTTEEEEGFDETTTPEARDLIMSALVKMVPALAGAQVVRQTACPRPLSADYMPLLGPAPGWDGVYVATGGGRSGIILGAAMGHITADLVARGVSDMPIRDFDPGRFAGG